MFALRLVGWLLMSSEARERHQDCVLTAITLRDLSHHDLRSHSRLTTASPLPPYQPIFLPFKPECRNHSAFNLAQRRFPRPELQSG